MNYYLILLFAFVYFDLSTELKILFDHFTFNAFYFAVSKHPLSFFIILTSPYLVKKVNKKK